MKLQCPHCLKDFDVDGDDGSIGSKARTALSGKIDAGELGAKDLFALVMKDLEVEQDRIKASIPKGDTTTERSRRAGRALGNHRGRFTRGAYEDAAT